MAIPVDANQLKYSVFYYSEFVIRPYNRGRGYEVYIAPSEITGGERIDLGVFRRRDAAEIAANQVRYGRHTIEEIQHLSEMPHVEGRTNPHIGIRFDKGRGAKQWVLRQRTAPYRYVKSFATLDQALLYQKIMGY
jgi:hypothetical protein